MFTTQIQVEDGSLSDYTLIRNTLKRKLFKAISNNKNENGVFNRRVSIGDSFMKQGEFPQIVKDVLNAVRRTGKAFSFTVIRTDHK